MLAEYRLLHIDHGFYYIKWDLIPLVVTRGYVSSERLEPNQRFFKSRRKGLEC